MLCFSKQFLFFSLLTHGFSEVLYPITFFLNTYTRFFDQQRLIVSLKDSAKFLVSLKFLRRIWRPFNFTLFVLADKTYDDNGSITDDCDGHDQMVMVVVSVYSKNEREHGAR